MTLEHMWTKVQPRGCGHKMHSEAFLADINLFQSHSITFTSKLHRENNRGEKLSPHMPDSFFALQNGVNQGDGLMEEMDNSMHW